MIRILFITLICIASSLGCYGQSSIFDKYTDSEGITSVYISKSMLGMLPSGSTKINGIQLGDITQRLDNIQILSCDEKAIIPQIRQEISVFSPKNGYEELMRIREDGEKVSIFYHKKRKEFVLVADEVEDITLISIVGDITLEEMKGIVDKM